MSIHPTERTIAPGTQHVCNGCKVVYADSRAAVRSVIDEPCGVVLIDAAMVREQPAVLRWLTTITRDSVVAIVGEVPERLGELPDVSLDGPVTETAVETLVEQWADRQAYLDAVERYYRAVERGAAGRELDAARRAADECAAALDAADWRAILAAIGE